MVRKLIPLFLILAATGCSAKTDVKALCMSLMGPIQATSEESEISLHGSMVSICDKESKECVHMHAASCMLIEAPKSALTE